jgi:CRP/FNR family transcriptional regulator
MERLDVMVRRSRLLSKGEVLFRTGEQLSSLYMIRSGSLKAGLLTNSGDDQIVGFFLPGELVGFDALGTNVHTCTATALEHSSVCFLPYDALTDLCNEVPALQASMMRLIGMEISTEQELLLNINRRQAIGRVASFLVSMSLRYKRLHYSPGEFRLSMSRYDLGNYLGLTIETVSRAMSRLQQAGLIAVDRRLVRLLDPDRLQRICNGDEDDAITPVAATGKR